MAKAETVRLEAGSPLRGAVKFVDFYAEKDNSNEPGKKMSAQWGFTGEWDNGEAVQAGRVYVDTYQLEQNPIAQGLVKQDGQWPDGNPKFKWIGGPKPVTLEKKIKDKKAHVRIITADGGAVPAQVGNGAQQAAGPVQGLKSVATPSPVALPFSQGPTAVWWEKKERLMRHCLMVASKMHTEFGDLTGLSETAHSLFIQANREGFEAPASKEEVAEAIRGGLDSFAGMPPALQGDEPVKPPWLE